MDCEGTAYAIIHMIAMCGDILYLWRHIYWAHALRIVSFTAKDTQHTLLLVFITTLIHRLDQTTFEESS